MIFGVSALVIDNNGYILAVSRKDDHTDFGLPGGKVEPGETPVQAMIRELLEETGFEIKDIGLPPQLIYSREEAGKISVTYLVDFSTLSLVRPTTEKGKVIWATSSMLVDGKTFGKYNSSLFESCGIYVPYTLSKQPIPTF